MTRKQKEWKTVTLKRETTKKLDELKIHPKQSYQEVVEKILEKKR